MPEPARHEQRLRDRGRLSRLTAAGNVMTGDEEVLLESWGQQFPSHSVGDLHFGPDGALYVSGGDGASFTNVDYGQYGFPKNPLGDPPASRRNAARCRPPPRAARCAARASVRAEGGPVLTNGTILRVDDDGNALPDNPLVRPAPNAIAQARRGLRPPQSLPFHDPAEHRLALDRRRGLERLGGDQPLVEPDRCDRDELRLALLRGRRPAARLSRGQSLASARTSTRHRARATGPFYAYNARRPRSSRARPARRAARRFPASLSTEPAATRRPTTARSSSATTRASASGSCFRTRRASRCRSTRATFVAGAATPVDLQIGPGGDLYYADHRRRHDPTHPELRADRRRDRRSPFRRGAAHGAVRRFGVPPRAPGRHASLTPGTSRVTGPTKIPRQQSPTHVYTQPGPHTARLRVTDNHDVSAAERPADDLRQRRRSDGRDRLAFVDAHTGRSATRSPSRATRRTLRTEPCPPQPCRGP